MISNTETLEIEGNALAWSDKHTKELLLQSVKRGHTRLSLIDVLWNPDMHSVSTAEIGSRMWNDTEKNTKFTLAVSLHNLRTSLPDWADVYRLIYRSRVLLSPKLSQDVWYTLPEDQEYITSLGLEQFPSDVLLWTRAMKVSSRPSVLRQRENLTPSSYGVLELLAKNYGHFSNYREIASKMVQYINFKPSPEYTRKLVCEAREVLRVGQYPAQIIKGRLGVGYALTLREDFSTNVEI